MPPCQVRLDWHFPGHEESENLHRAQSFPCPAEEPGSGGGGTLVGGKDSKAVPVSLEGPHAGEAHDGTAWGAACSAHGVRAPSKGHLDQVIIERAGRVGGCGEVGSTGPTSRQNHCSDGTRSCHPGRRARMSHLLLFPGKPGKKARPYFWHEISHCLHFDN